VSISVCDVADGVVAALNAAEFSLDFVATRGNQPAYDLAELTDLAVTVIPGAYALRVLTRNTLQRDYDVVVAVQKRVSGPDDDAVDDLLALAVEIIDAVKLSRLATQPTAIWTGATNAQIYDPEHMLQRGLFTSYITLSYRVGS